MPLEVQSELFQRTASLVHKKPGKQPDVKLHPLDTTTPPYSSDGSSSLSSVSESPRSFSASRSRFGKTALKTPRDLQVPKNSHQQLQPNKPLPEAPQPRLSPRDFLNKLLPSPLFGLQPPLSARSAVFLVSLQQMFSSTVDTYLYRRGDGSSQSPRPQQGYVGGDGKFTSDDMLEAQRVPSATTPLALWRKLLIALSILSMLATVVLLIVLVRVDHMGTRRASRWLMAGSGALVLLAALMMFAARRPLAEVLVMAVLGVLICQCVMDDFHALVHVRP